MRFTIYLLFFMLLTCSSLRAQLLVNQDVQVSTAIAEDLIGPGIEITNITFNQSDADLITPQFGTFESNDSNVGLSSGIIISNGLVYAAQGPNNSSAISTPDLGVGTPGDADLEILSGLPTYDAGCIEFDFIPTGDSLSFQFVFASDEYPEFSQSQFNDAFGFFLSGPGFSGEFSSPIGFDQGAQNLALIPGTNSPITINSINNGPEDQGPCVNCDYLTSNGDGISGPQFNDQAVLQYDGILLPITIKVAVSCGETYHMKIAIADVADTGYDSAIFIASGSFQTESSFDISVIDPYPASDNGLAVYEDCYPVVVQVERSPYWTYPTSLALTTQGTASEGQDYAELPSTLPFDIGTAAHELTIEALQDGLLDDQETIELLFEQQTCIGIESQAINLDLLEVSEIVPTYANSPTDCGDDIPLTTNISGGIGEYQISWSTGQMGDSILLAWADLDALELTVSGACASTVTVPVDIDLASDIFPEVELPNEISLVCGSYALNLNPFDSNSLTDGISAAWQFDGLPISNELLLETNLPVSGLLTLDLINNCGGELAYEIPVTAAEYTAMSADFAGDNYLCQGGETAVEASISGGIGPFDYSWSHGEANGAECLVSSDISFNLTLSVQDACGNSTMASQLMEVSTLNADFMLEETELLGFQAIGLSEGASTGALNYSWWVDNVLVQEGNAVLDMDYEHDLDHEVSLLISDDNGCVNQLTQSIRPSPRVYVPSCFSPDGDQLNEAFKVEGIGITEVHISVYDRMGELVFEAFELDESWSGDTAMQSGEFSGIYTYVIQARGFDDSVIERTGVLSMIR